MTYLDDKEVARLIADSGAPDSAEVRALLTAVEKLLLERFKDNAKYVIGNLGRDPGQVYAEEIGRLRGDSRKR